MLARLPISKRLRGQVGTEALVGMGLTLLLTAFGSIGIANKLSNDRDFDQAQRIASLEAKVERIPIIEAKIDELLKRK